jgi:hypothetical protein
MRCSTAGRGKRMAECRSATTMYHTGAETFFADWQTFTGSPTPVVINPNPMLVLIAATFDDRTRSALEFLVENNLPARVVPVPICGIRTGTMD